MLSSVPWPTECQRTARWTCRATRAPPQRHTTRFNGGWRELVALVVEAPAGSVVPTRSSPSQLEKVAPCRRSVQPARSCVDALNSANSAEKQTRHSPPFWPAADRTLGRAHTSIAQFYRRGVLLLFHLGVRAFIDRAAR